MGDTLKAAVAISPAVTVEVGACTRSTGRHGHLDQSIRRAGRANAANLRGVCVQRDAALRALDATDPAPSLVALELAYCALRGLLQRSAGVGMARAA